jgi:hypothetical protein
MKKWILIVIALLFLLIPLNSFTQSTVDKESVEQQLIKEVFEGSKAITKMMFVRDAGDGTWTIILESPTKAFFFSGARLDGIKRK